MSDRPTRIEAARRRADAAKRALAAAAAVVFLGAGVLARLAHPGHAGTTPADGTGGPAVSTNDGNGILDFGTGSIGPSGGSTPQGSTHVS